MRRWQDTPRRYIYDGIWGFSAIMALRYIQMWRRFRRENGHTEPSPQLEADRKFFANELKKHNDIRPTRLR